MKKILILSFFLPVMVFFAKAINTEVNTLYAAHAEYTTAPMNFIPSMLDDTVKTALQKAEALVREGKPTEASKIYNNIMKNHPNNKGAVQGWLMVNMKRSPTGEKDAIHQLDSLGRIYPENTGILFFKAFLEAEFGLNEEALRDANKLIELQPDTSLNYIAKGQVLYAMENYDEAFKAFDKATSLDPSRSDVWGMKASALARTGRYDEAIVAINKGVDMDPENPVNFYNRACMYSLKGDKVNALTDLEKAISMNPAFKQHARNDTDFKNLSNEEGFKKLIE